MLDLDLIRQQINNCDAQENLSWIIKLFSAGNVGINDSQKILGLS
jgi:hypothetical protein